MISWERKTSLIKKKSLFLAKVTSVIFASLRLTCILFLYFVVDNPDVISCDFESGFCGWSQSKADDADFSRNTGLLRTPTADHTPGKGLFIYITWKMISRCTFVSYNQTRRGVILHARYILLYYSMWPQWNIIEKLWKNRLLLTSIVNHSPGKVCLCRLLSRFY